jgi:hypothetical protein
MIFVLVNIIGDIGNIALWYGIPSLQTSLQGGLIASALGAGEALAAGTGILAAVSTIYAVSLFGLFKRQKGGSLLVIAISVANRAFALLLFEVKPPFFFVWTGILVFAAFIDYRCLTAPFVSSESADINRKSQNSATLRKTKTDSWRKWSWDKNGPRILRKKNVRE